MDAGICPPIPIECEQPDALVAAAAGFLREYHQQEHRLGFDDFPSQKARWHMIFVKRSSAFE